MSLHILDTTDNASRGMASFGNINIPTRMCAANLEANIDTLNLGLDFHGRSSLVNQLDMAPLHHAEVSPAEQSVHANNTDWQSQIAAFLGANAAS